MQRGDVVKQENVDASSAVAHPGPNDPRIYDVGKVVAHLFDLSRNRYERAIKLYELGVSMLHCRGFPGGPPKTPPRFEILVPPRVLRQARIFAEQRLLDKVIQDAASECPDRNRKRRYWMTISNSDFEAVFSRYLRDGGHRVNLSRPQARKFQAELVKNRKRLKMLVKVIDFSMRANVTALRPPQAAGYTTARDLLTERRMLGVRKAPTTIDNWWHCWQPVAILAYLEFPQKYEVISPPTLLSKRFAESLLDRADDTTHLRAWLASYLEAHLRLRQRGYNGIPALPVSISEPLPPFDLSIWPLPPKVQRALDCFHKQSHRPT